jgi:hypothetical protein
VGISPNKKYDNREKATIPKEKPTNLPGQTVLSK